MISALIWENVSGNIAAVNASLVDENGKEISSVSTLIKRNGWQKYTTVFKSTTNCRKSKTADYIYRKRHREHGYDLTFPTRHRKGRKGGLRKDLVQKLYDLQPGF